MTAVVVDASAVVDLLLRNRLGVVVRAQLADVDLHTVSHLDAEVFSALARLHRARELSTESVTARLRLLATFDVTRHPISGPLLEEAWELRDNVTARDAFYVALARQRGDLLLTTDRRLGRAVGDLAVPLPP